jgi:hypothetical protein
MVMSTADGPQVPMVEVVPEARMALVASLVEGMWGGVEMAEMSVAKREVTKAVSSAQVIQEAEKLVVEWQVEARTVVDQLGVETGAVAVMEGILVAVRREVVMTVAALRVARGAQRAEHAATVESLRLGVAPRAVQHGTANTFPCLCDPPPQRA